MPTFRTFPLVVSPMALEFALTGGIACGKSMAEACFAECGCRVFDADAAVRAAEAPGGVAVEPIVARFGSAVRAADGGIDRRALAALAFGDASARRSLEAIVHPLVREAAERWRAAAGRDDVSVFSAALLFECGWDAQWPQGTVCVTASEATQLRRMLRTRGMTEAEARARLAAQMPTAEKARRARWTLDNDQDDLPALRAQVRALVARWRAGAE